MYNVYVYVLKITFLCLTKIIKEVLIYNSIILAANTLIYQLTGFSAIGQIIKLIKKIDKMLAI